MQEEIVEALSRPQTYGVTRVERHETHGSYVFLAGERAYKLKKEVHFPYMDYSTVERRKAMCAAELAVNRPLAPDLYLGVAAVIRDSSGHIRPGTPDQTDGALDWLVVMRRFREEDLFAALCAKGALTLPMMQDAATCIAAFHRKAVSHSTYGGAAAIAAVIDENRDMLSRLAGHPFDGARIAELDRSAREALRQTASLLDARRAQGFVRRCHGDLHLNNICLWQGRPVLFDAIEFSDAFAIIDVFYDLAFLLMDMDRRGLRGLANAVLNRYLEETGDYDGLAALPLFLSCRAALRAHIVVSMASREPGSALTAATVAEASHLLDLAIAYLAPATARAVAIGGPSGTGKSTLAAALAPDLGRAPGAVVLRTDILRKRLAGVDRFTRLPPAHYTQEASDRVYAELEDCARRVLAAGQAVIADGVFGRSDERLRIAAVAKTAKTRFDGLWLEAPASLLATRLEARRNDASDATPEVLARQLTQIEAPSDWHRLPADAEMPELATEARQILG